MFSTSQALGLSRPNLVLGTAFLQSELISKVYWFHSLSKLFSEAPIPPPLTGIPTTTTPFSLPLPHVCLIADHNYDIA